MNIANTASAASTADAATATSAANAATAPGTTAAPAANSVKKVVLAYSGGLDTSIIITWLKENYGCEVIALAADVGQGAEEFEGLEAKALATGASKLYIADIQDELVEDFIWPTLKAGARYETYLLGTSFARPPIAKALVETARKEGADAIVHGCTGKGNDQVRFELTAKALAPDLRVIAPWREWDIKSREDAIEYAELHQIPLKITRETNYSKDRNLWHLSHEGLDLEDPANEPDYDKILELGVTPEAAPDVPTYVTLTFEKGVPVALDGERLKGVALIERLNRLGGANGVGIIDLVENRLVGMKSRGVYETPGGAILYHAHDALETICLDKETAHFKLLVAQKYADLVYNGQWYSPLRVALDAFVDSTQQAVCGDVRLKLYKGTIITAGMTSPYSLYDTGIASFGESDYDHADAAGFINLFGLPMKIAAQRRGIQQ
jgi:argininosuccinate synthase